MKNFKRIVGLLLCLAMVLSFMPVTHTHVHAAEPVQPGTTTTTTDPITQGTVLQIVPNTKITTVFGCYTDGTGDDESTFEDGEDGYCVTDGWFGRYGGSVKTPNDGLVALVMTLSEAMTIGGMELTRYNSSNDPVDFEVQAWVDGEWVELHSQTTNPFASANTQMISFANTATTTKVRMLVNEISGGDSQACKLYELTLFESTTGNVYNKIDIDGRASSTNAGASLTYLVDSDKGNAFLGTNVTIDLTDNGQPTSVDGFNLYLHRGNQNYPSNVTVQIQKTAGGDYEEVGTFSTSWSNSYPEDVLIAEFDQAYDAYNIRFEFDKNCYLNGLELFQYERGASEPSAPGTTTVGTPDLKKLDLTNSVVGCDSQNSATQSDYTKLTWYSTLNPGWKELSYFTDGDYTNEVYWGLDPHERADVYIDLTKNTGAAVTVDQFKLYHSTYRDVGSVYFALILADGTTMVENTAALNWKQGVAADPYVYTYDQTYTAVGLYVWQPDNNPTNGIRAAFGEIEMWQKKTVQLPAPKNLQTTEVTDNSITVAANTVSAGGKLQFSRDGSNWYDADGYSYTFTGLTASTPYTIQARYLSTDASYITTVTPASIEVTTEELDCEHEYTDCEDTVCNLCSVVRVAPGHSYDDCEDTSCANCTVTRTAPGHKYTDCEDTTCDNNCGATRTAPGHKYTDCADTTCDNDCGATRTAPGHKYTDCEDTTCDNGCGYTRAAGAHTYSNACDDSCNECGATRTVGDHVYDNACDASCNECGATRTPADHVYDNEYDASCNECGHTRIVVYPEIPGLTEIEDLPIPVIGYYTDINGTIVDPQSAPNIVDDNTGNYAASQYFTHEEAANGTKVPAILFTFDSTVTLGAIEIWGYEAYRYNMEDFEVQVYVDGAWKTVTATVDAFHVDGAVFGDDLTGDNQWLKLYFDKVYSTTQLRILVSGMSDMSEDADEVDKDGTTNEHLYTGSYIRVREIKLYESQCEHAFDNCEDTTCNNGCGYTRAPIAHSYSDCEDTTCNNTGCNETREAPGHKYDNVCDATCNNGCGHIREVPDHVYDNACDDSCNVCGEIREVTHNYDNGCDTECNDCGAIREAEHTYDNNCDADCNECGYLRPDATGHKYDDDCDADCNNCGFERVASHVYDSCEDTECNACGTTRTAIAHVYKNECDPDCDVCGKNAGLEISHVFDSDCDDVCNKCGSKRVPPHRYDSIYSNVCTLCGDTSRTVQEKPVVPYYEKTKVELSTPIFGYYSNRDTNGTITPYYITETNSAGDIYGPPNLLIDGGTTKYSRAESLYYNYVEIQQGIKIPVILFNFAEPTNVCSVNIYGYEYGYYNIETFDVQVYTDGAWVNVAHVTNAFTDGVYQTQVTTPLTVTFDKAYEATQLRILVRKVTNMLGRGDVTTGDDDFGYSAPFRIKEIEIYKTDAESITYPNDMTLNGVDIGNYVIVYTDELDYNKRAAEYLQSIIYKKTGRTLTIVEDNEGESTYEILVGNTNRTLSTAWDAPDNQAMKFHIRTDGTKIVLEAEYFIIAGAAYYFGEKFVPDVNNAAKTVPTARQELDPITEPANNYIMMIGDGMGVNQTKLFDVFNVPTSGEYDYSDGEDVFFGYYFPYEGRSRTWNVIGQITDSAAGGTALSTGYKTTNGTIALDWYGNEIKTLTELALELNLAAGVFSTEGSDGATPASFSAHTTGRYDDEIITDQAVMEQKGVLFVDRYIDSTTTPDANNADMTASEWATYEAKVRAGLNNLASDPDGFFVMYEEAHIDKYLHKGEIDNVFRAVYRFNQAIGIFMEYAMYNPDTIVLITADHETGGIELGAANSGEVEFNTPNPPDEAAGSSKWNHSEKDVPVFAYGFGMEVFDTDINAADGYYENASIGRTYAHFMTNGHADDFGDPWYPILVKGTTPEEYPEDPMTLKTNETLNEINLAGKVTGSYTQSVARNDPATITINLTNADGTPTNVKKMIISASNVSAAPATTIVEAQVEVNGEKVWLQIYKETLYGKRYGKEITDGILDFHTFYNAYQVKITVNSINNDPETEKGYGTMAIDGIKLYGYSVKTPDVGGVVTSGGDENENAVVQLMQGDEVIYTAIVDGDRYYVMDVAAGDYTVVATKNGHITVEYEITVGSEPVRQDVKLKYVSQNTAISLSQSVRLIEPWAMRSYIQYVTDETERIYLTGILGYGAYGIIQHKADGTPDSWDDIVYNEKAIKFEKSFTDGDEKISHTSSAGYNRRYSVMFDFYDMLYTYRMAEEVYWVTFYEDAQGIHFTNIKHESLSGLIDTILEQGNAPDTEETVLGDMKTLHQELIEYRGPDADLGNTPYPQGVKLSESGIAFEDVNTGAWQFGRRRQIRLIEPWGFKVTLRFKEVATDTIIADPNATAADYGMIFYHDKIDRYVNNGMSYETMLAQDDALVFSKSLNNMIVDGDSVLAIYTKDIYTYQLDSELYCLPFIKIGNQYYFPKNAVCWNLLEEMETIRDDTVNRVEKERDVFAAMVNLYYDVTKHLGYDE